MNEFSAPTIAELGAAAHVGLTTFEEMLADQLAGAFVVDADLRLLRPVRRQDGVDRDDRDAGRIGGLSTAGMMPLMSMATTTMPSTFCWM